MIHDDKDHYIIQDSSQEPSSSSKYDFKDRVLLKNFFSHLMAEIWQTD